MSRSRAAIVAAIAVVLTAGSMAPALADRPVKDPAASKSAPAKRHRSSHPAPTLPAGYEASARGGRPVEQIEWHNPRSAKLRKVVVRYARGSIAPTSVHRGHGVHLGKRKAEHVSLTHLAANAGYVVSIFAVYRDGRVSRPAVAHFTTPGHVGTTTVRGTLRGWVTDSTGAPLTGARVVAFNRDTYASAGTTTNASGAYVLGLAPGAWAIGASGERATGGDSDATGYITDETGASVKSNRTVSAPTLALKPGAEVTGRILDEHGRPIAGAYPYLAPPTDYADGFGSDSDSDFFLSFQTSGDGSADTDPVTAPDGRFAIRGVRPGEAVVLCASAQHAVAAGKHTDFYSACQSRTRAIGARHTIALTDLVLHSGTGAAVTGRLRNAKGRGLAGFVGLSNGKGRSLYALTEADGRYRLDGVPAGRYVLCGMSDSAAGSRTGYAPACSKRPVVVGRSGTVRASKVLPPGAAVAGTVTGPRGQRLANVRVGLTEGSDDSDDIGGGFAEATTNRIGQWRVIGLPLGSYSACFDASGVKMAGTGALPGCWAAGKSFDLRVGRVRSGINAHLRTGGALTGVVRDRSGKPVPYAEVEIIPAGADPDDLAGEGNDVGADARGRYRATGLPAGTYRICALGETTDVACGARAKVRLGATATAAPIVLPPATAIEVHVVDSTGTPVAGADVAAMTACTERDFCARTNLLGGAKADVEESEITDADGSTVLDAERGRYAVCAFGYFGTTVQGGSPTGYADTCHGKGFDVVVRSHATTTVTITLADGGAVSGTVTDSAGRRYAHARIVVPGSTVDDAPTYPIGLTSGRAVTTPALSDFATPDISTANLTDAGGHFSVIGVRPGTWSVCAIDDRVATARFGPACSGGTKATVTVTADATTPANVVVKRR